MEKEAYDGLRAMQDHHWWYAGRKRVVRKILSTETKSADLRILDIGSGFGGMLDCLTPYGRVDCIEPNVSAWDALRMSGASRIFEIYDFPDTYPDSKYDAVTLFDVLEHIESDRGALKVIRGNLLADEGFVLLTVPAHMWLWSEHDVMNHHFRRYSIGRLSQILDDAGFEVVKTGYFMSLLFPAAVIQRIADRKPQLRKNGMTPPPGPVNEVFSRVFCAEGAGFGFGRYPIGLSLAAIGRKSER